MNAPDSLEDDLRTLLEPVRPELKARIAGEFHETNTAQKLTANTRSASLLAAGVMVLLAAGLFAMVRPARQATVAESQGDIKILKQNPSADGGAETAPLPVTPPHDGAADGREKNDNGKKGLSGTIELRLYDVRDFGGSGPASLKETILKAVRPDSWSKELGTSIADQNGQLVVMQYPEVHDAIAAYLKKVRDDAAVKSVENNGDAVEQSSEAVREREKNQEQITRLKGVILKQQQALIIERENAERARQEKAKLEAELTEAKTEQAPSKNKSDEPAEAKNTDESNRWYAKTFGSPELYSKIQRELIANKPLTPPAGGHLDAGKRLFSTFEYEDARKEFELAVTADPKNEEVLRWLARANEILGVRRERIKSAVAELYGERKVAVQEKMIELDNCIDSGRRFLSKARSSDALSPADSIQAYQQAQAVFERAGELIRWLPIEVNVNEQKNEVERFAKETAIALKAAGGKLPEIAGADFDAHPKPEAARKTEIEKALKMKVTFDFTERPLGDAISNLRTASKLTFIVDPKIVANGKDKTPITLKVQEMELDAALKWVLKAADLDFEIRQNVIFVTEKANTAEAVELRIYDIDDLVGIERESKGPKIQLQTVDSPGGPSHSGIADAIQQRVRPDQWDPKLGTSIEEMAGRLVVMQRPEIHRLIEQYLDGLRKKKRLAKSVAYHVKNLKDTDADVREASCEMLAALGSEEAVPALIEVLDPERKEKEPVRTAAHSALRKISGKEFELGDYAGWKDWWKSLSKPKDKSEK